MTTASHELALTIINDGEYYADRCDAARCKDQRIASSKFQRFAAIGAAKYTREFGTPGEQIFTAQDILLAAAELAEYYAQHVAEMDAPNSSDSVTRYCVTHMDRDGQRVLTGPCQARFTFGTETEAQAHADAITANNSTSNLEQAYGPQAIGTFEVRPVECWRMADGRHGDPKRVYFDC